MANVLTRSGYQRLSDKLEHLRTVERNEVAERLRSARATGGDLAENGEYLDAKEEQERLEQRIAALEQQLADADVVDAAAVAGDVVCVGTVVRLVDGDEADPFEFAIVGSAEADPIEGRLSNESPVGKAIVGRRRGERVLVDTPGGRRAFTIVDVRAQKAA